MSTIIDLTRRANQFRSDSDGSVEKGFRGAVSEHPLSLPMILLSTIALLGLSVLCYYHFKITLNNMTTNEELKGVFSSYVWHPYDLN